VTLISRIFELLACEDCNLPVWPFNHPLGWMSGSSQEWWPARMEFGLQSYADLAVALRGRAERNIPYAKMEATQTPMLTIKVASSNDSIRVVMSKSPAEINSDTADSSLIQRATRSGVVNCGPNCRISQRVCSSLEIPMTAKTITRVWLIVFSRL